MTSVIEIGRISSRGQVAIPQDIREEMGLSPGEKVLFILEDDSLLLIKVSSLSWDEITKPLREAKKKISKEEVDDLVHKDRK